MDWPGDGAVTSGVCGGEPGQLRGGAGSGGFCEWADAGRLRSGAKVVSGAGEFQFGEGKRGGGGFERGAGFRTAAARDVLSADSAAGAAERAFAGDAV